MAYFPFLERTVTVNNNKKNKLMAVQYCSNQSLLLVI